MTKIVDFSHHQGNVNWLQSASELDLAIIRVQYGSKTVDRKYREYVEGCKANGIPFGHYAYCLFVSVKDAIKEAEDFHKRADKDALFLVADVEEQTTKTKGEMAPATQAFIDTLKAKGWKVGLYSGHHTYTPLGMNKVKADFVWIPRYGNKKPDFACDLWQFTETGRLAGVSGNVDLNKLTGSKPLSYFLGDVQQSSKELTLIEWMKVKGMDPSKANRAKLAKEYGIKGYDYSAKKNLELYAALKFGKPKKEEAKVEKKPNNTPSKSHEDAWTKAKQKGYMDGTRPHDPVTREQLATIIERMSK